VQCTQKKLSNSDSFFYLLETIINLLRIIKYNQYLNTMVELNKTIRDYSPHNVSKSTITDVCAKYCVDERNEIYYMAYETDKEKPISVLWSDLKFLHRNYGIELFNDECKITKGSLNHGRLIHINKLKLCIEVNVHERALEYWNGTDFGTMPNHNYMKTIIYNGKISTDFNKDKPRIPEALTKSCKKYYQEDIAKGLYIICKYV